VDTGSAVNILSEHLYLQHFADNSLAVPNVRLVTYLKKTIPDRGCLAITVTFEGHLQGQASFYIVPGGTPLLGIDLFTDLQLEIRNGSIASFAEDSQTTANFTEPLGVAGFEHKVNVCSNVPLVQLKLCRLPFAVREAVSQELQMLESEGIFEKVPSSPWVLPVVVIQKKSGGFKRAKQSYRHR